MTDNVVTFGGSQIFAARTYTNEARPRRALLPERFESTSLPRSTDVECAQATPYVMPAVVETPVFEIEPAAQPG